MGPILKIGPICIQNKLENNMLTMKRIGFILYLMGLVLLMGCGGKQGEMAVSGPARPMACFIQTMAAIGPV
jgi:hypothetical protein